MNTIFYMNPDSIDAALSRQVPNLQRLKTACRLRISVSLLRAGQCDADYKDCLSAYIFIPDPPIRFRLSVQFPASTTICHASLMKASTKDRISIVAHSTRLVRLWVKLGIRPWIQLLDGPNNVLLSLRCAGRWERRSLTVHCSNKGRPTILRDCKACQKRSQQQGRIQPAGSNRKYVTSFELWYNKMSVDHHHKITEQGATCC